MNVPELVCFVCCVPPPSKFEKSTPHSTPQFGLPERGCSKRDETKQVPAGAHFCCPLLTPILAETPFVVKVKELPKPGTERKEAAILRRLPQTLPFSGKVPGSETPALSGPKSSLSLELSTRLPGSLPGIPILS